MLKLVVHGLMKPWLEHSLKCTPHTDRACGAGRVVRGARADCSTAKTSSASETLQESNGPVQDLRSSDRKCVESYLALRAKESATYEPVYRRRRK